MSFQFDQPVVYVIRVAGALDASWSDCLGGLSIALSEPIAEGAMPVTILTGLFADQVALSGVLNTLCDNRYALLSVECLGPG